MSKKLTSKPLDLAEKLATERDEILAARKTAGDRLEYLNRRSVDLESQRRDIIENAPKNHRGGAVPGELLDELGRVDDEIRRLTDQDAEHARRLAEIDRLMGASERVKNLAAELANNRDKFDTARREIERVDTAIDSLTGKVSRLEAERKSILDDYSKENVAALADGRPELKLPPRLLTLTGEIEASRASLETARNLKTDVETLLDSLETTAGHLKQVMTEARFALAEFEFLKATQEVMPAIIQYAAFGRALGHRWADDIRLPVDPAALEAATTALYAELR
jgi:chromosome segregation ATPase